MADDLDKSTIKVSPFSGKSTDWPVWREKFLARAHRKGYKKVLHGKEKVPEDSETLDPVKDADKVKVREQNELAYEELILLIDGNTATGRVAFNIVRGSKTATLADGDAALAWSRLCNKYKPKSAPSRLALQNQFNTMALKSASQDPDVWLTDLEDLRVQLLNAGSNISEEATRDSTQH